MLAGSLHARLSVKGNRRFRLFLDRFDPEYGEWEQVATVRTRNGEAVLDADIEAGEYSFAILSRGRGGRYALDADLTTK